MNDIIKNDILIVLKRIIDILRVKEDRDIAEIMELSNHTIHNCSIFQDEDSVAIAILIYSLSKLIERKQGQIKYQNFISLLQGAENLLGQNKIDGYRKNVRKLFDYISSIDSKLKLYIGEVINQAEIKKGGKLYEHGISLARAAEILGISQWELMSYVGKTKLTDIKGGIDIKRRINYARGLFK